MPTYDYKCPSCGTPQSDVMQRSWRDPAPLCACGERTTKVVTAPVVHMNGHEAVPRGSSYGAMAPRPRPNLSHIPTVTKDGGLVSADGRQILNPDGSRAG